METAQLWLLIGFLGQACFSARFVVQWLASERVGQCIIPIRFWHLSLVGGAILLAYAVYLGDPVFIVGQAAGLVIYARNLTLSGRRRSTAPAASIGTTGPIRDERAGQSRPVRAA